MKTVRIETVRAFNIFPKTFSNVYILCIYNKIKNQVLNSLNF